MLIFCHCNLPTNFKTFEIILYLVIKMLSSHLASLQQSKRAKNCRLQSDHKIPIHTAPQTGTFERYPAAIWWQL